MHYLTFITGVHLAASGGGADGSRNVLIGSIFTGTVTLILGLTATFATRPRRRSRDEPPMPTPIVPPLPPEPERDSDDDASTIADLRKQRDAVQRKYDNCLNHGEEAKIEIQRLRDLLWAHNINPESTMTVTPPPPNRPSPGGRANEHHDR